MGSSVSTRLAVASLLIMLSGCSSTGPSAEEGGSPTNPVSAPGTVTGKLVSQRADGSHQAPLAAQLVGVFRQVVIPGKPQQHPPTALMTAVTGPDGSFVFRGLQPGRYFVTVAGKAPPSVAGHWVTLTSERGVFVLLILCTDCPGPL